MILSQSNYLTMWHGVWACCMPWIIKVTEPWLPLKVADCHLEFNCKTEHAFFLSHHKIFSGELAHALRFLASVVSQSFLAFGDILELHRKFLELSGGINRISELEELLDAAHSGKFFSPHQLDCGWILWFQSFLRYAENVLKFNVIVCPLMASFAMK